MNKDINYYQILGITHNSDKKEIKNNYRQLSKQHHPDRNNGDETNFILLAEAYKVLTTIGLRERYDLNSKYGRYYDPFLELLEFEFSNTNSTSLNMKNQKDKFKNDMIHIVLELSTFTNEIEYDRNIVCIKCEGTGSISILDTPLVGKMGNLFNSDELECDICEGVGIYDDNECPACHGNGYVKFGLSKCSDCNGKGIKSTRKKISLNIDDFKDGKLKMSYHGNHLKDGRVGHLFIIIKDLLKKED